MWMSLLGRNTVETKKEMKKQMGKESLDLT